MTKTKFIQIIQQEGLDVDTNRQAIDWLFHNLQLQYGDDLTEWFVRVLAQRSMFAAKNNLSELDEVTLSILN